MNLKAVQISELIIPFRNLQSLKWVNNLERLFSPEEGTEIIPKTPPKSFYTQVAFC